MRILFTSIILILGFLPSGHANDFSVEVSAPKIMLTNVPFTLHMKLKPADDIITVPDTSLSVKGISVINEKTTESYDYIRFIAGEANVNNVIFEESGIHNIQFAGERPVFQIRIIPGWLSLLPPFLAIILALILRQVLVALFAGIWTGVSIVYGYNPFKGLFYSVSEYIARAPADPDKMSIIIFSLALGGMIGVISKMGGTQGIVEKLAQYASNARRGQFITWLMGIFIFFDDYANTLIVGSTMRPLLDKLRISREKLSYLVDSTAAPVANIAVISTWIGFEIGLIGSAFNILGIDQNAYLTFFKTIPYNYYPIFTLAIGLWIALSGRDFGPMYHAEKRAYKKGQVLRPNANPMSSLDAAEITASDDIPKRWFNGFIPVSVVIVTTLAGLWYTGYQNFIASGVDRNSIGIIQYISLVIGGSDSYSVLMWASFMGSFVALGLAISQRLMKLEHAIQSWVGGVKAMVMAVLILTMAWSIGNICADLKTADYVVEVSKDLISAQYVPLLSFLTAAIISFATGTSWGVMAILMPIVIPIAYLLPQADTTISAIHQQSILLSTIASVLAGATFGDHCSPISDTTIMSSMATSADHIDHVRTQLPYAMLGGVASMIFGYIPVGFGITNWIILPVGLLMIFVFLHFIAKDSRI